MPDAKAQRKVKLHGDTRCHGRCAWLVPCLLSGGSLLAVGSLLALPLVAQIAPQQSSQTAPRRPATKTAAVPSVAAPHAPTNLLEQPPVAATVTQRNNALTVKADNSSLSDTLRRVASATGMKLDGLGGDERVFGSFGPGAPGEVLTSLLNGSHYNVLMIGALPNGAPRQMVLMRKPASGSAAGSATESQPAPAQPDAASQAPNADEEDPGAAEEPDGPQQAPSIQPAVIPRPGVPEPVPPGQPVAPGQPPGQQPGQPSGQPVAPGQQQPGQPDQPQVRTPQQFLQQIQQQQDLPPAEQSPAPPQDQPQQGEPEPPPDSPPE